MLASILTAFFYAASGICGRRSAVAFGSLRGNSLRLGLAILILAVVTRGAAGLEWSSESTRRLLWSGAVGFGLGDVALFLAYTRLGARLTLLLNLCSAPVFGALGDWLLLGVGVSGPQVLSTAMILAGVSFAVGSHGGAGGIFLPKPKLFTGVIFALLAGLGQGGGASLSRFAHAAMRVEEHMVPPVQQALVRMLPGLLFTLVLWGAAVSYRSIRRVSVETPMGSYPRRWWWLLGAAMFGPVLGVSCFQWALIQAPALVVLSITATTPILIMPLSAIIDHDRAGKLAILGSFVGVAGVILMVWVTGR
ncbi:EamA-like transporter family protein [Roseimicrobium gellanilyticum]|uniref:EamA-like transporter family protein n=1 Tax=Roseimicrobium gellanilyticum TaxID=748857 RepID=A0A366HV55_9BACT|nr:EamA-like transporter family protein [Roseimicrobium gellanilyticum]